MSPKPINLKSLGPSMSRNPIKVVGLGAPRRQPRGRPATLEGTWTLRLHTGVVLTGAATLSRGVTGLRARDFRMILFMFCFWEGGCAAPSGPEGTGKAHRCRRQRRQAATQRGKTFYVSQFVSIRLNAFHCILARCSNVSTFRRLIICPASPVKPTPVCKRMIGEGKLGEGCATSN